MRYKLTDNFEKDFQTLGKATAETFKFAIRSTSNNLTPAESKLMTKESKRIKEFIENFNKKYDGKLFRQKIINKGV